jgi:hypothetical protein
VVVLRVVVLRAVAVLLAGSVLLLLVLVGRRFRRHVVLGSA